MADSKQNDADEDNNMTPEERLAWLRERGVQVTTPEERKVAQVVDAMRQAELASEEDEIAYVLIPADSSKPLAQQSFLPNRLRSRGGDLLVEHLRSAFQAGSDNVDLDLLKQQQSTQTLASSSGELPTVSDQTLRKVATEASVETFTLVHPVPSNGFVGVNIYLDEIGLLKRLPLNKRASELAARAGFDPPPQFYGDVYVGRVKAKPVVTNASFVVGPDTAPDAPWLLRATNENLEYQQELNRVTGRSERQPAVAGTEKSKDEEGFSWTQTEDELELTIELASDIASKDIQVKFRSQAVSVTARGEERLSVQLFERVELDGCAWTLETIGERKKLILTMEKTEQALWPRIKD